MGRLREYTYEVCKGCTVMAKNLPPLKPGDRFEGANTVVAPSEKWLDDACRQGFIRSVRLTNEPVKDTLGEDSPGREVGPAVPHTIDIDRPTPSKQSPVVIPLPQTPPANEIGRQTDPGTGITQTVSRPDVNPVGDPISQVTSIWTLDPGGLRTKSLAELNVMVQERDKGVAPFSAATDAIALLSRDFKPAPSA